MYLQNRLYCSPSDSISDLPDPDQDENIPKLIKAIGGDIGIQEMYAGYPIKSPPELLSMNLCFALETEQAPLTETARQSRCS